MTSHGGRGHRRFAVFPLRTLVTSHEGCGHRCSAVLPNNTAIPVEELPGSDSSARLLRPVRRVDARANCRQAHQGHSEVRRLSGSMSTQRRRLVATQPPNRSDPTMPPRETAAPGMLSACNWSAVIPPTAASQAAARATGVGQDSDATAGEEPEVESHA